MSHPCSPDTDVAGIGDVGAFIAACLIASSAAAFTARHMWQRRPDEHSGFLDDILSILSTTQIIYGGAILSALYKRHQSGLSVSVIKHDPYYHLIVYMMLANVSSGFACALGLGLNGDVFKARARAVLYLVVIIFYCILLIMGYAQDREPADEFCVSLLLTVIGVLSNIWNVYAWWKRRLSKRWVIFNVAIQVVSTLIGVIYTILLRWNVYGEQVEGCNLNSPANNELDYGQIIAIMLTLAIPVQILEAFYDNMDDPLAKSALEWLGCYQFLKRQRRPIEQCESDTNGSVELPNRSV